VLAAADDRAGAGGDARRTRSGTVMHTPQGIMRKSSEGGAAGPTAAEDLPELPHLDFSDLPNTAETRKLREYAAQCETHVQLHQTWVRIASFCSTKLCHWSSYCCPATLVGVHE
jgi:hypothetical protein